MFTIEKNVPRATTVRGRKATEFPLADLEKGDSFYIPLPANHEKKHVDSWRRKLMVAKKRVVETAVAAGIAKPEFGSAIVDGTNKDADGNPVAGKGIRVWRTA